MEEQTIRVQDLFDALKKRWRLIVIITLVSVILASILSFFIIKPQYEASTKIFIGKEDTESQGYNQNDVLMYQKLMKTYSEAIKTKDLVSKALDKGNIKLDESKVLKNLTVVPVADTQILQIKFRSKNREEAKNVIKVVTDQFIATSKELVPNGNIKIIEQVSLPEKPVSPNKKMNIAIAFLLGIMIGTGLCLLLEFMDNTFKTKEQLERELDIPVIGVIPKVENE
ncbi:YveK family protein [Clostridium septicum]|uniref:Capsular biosynthesis protein n=1 Tax=Clostridium septicum TaxID=1504 RepID=A0A9N7PIR2_CLOSE|nr:Wzz/FepE/Etk N-terminal domain-containing protein [Clostridium septicum]AYE33896.1 capsular biosynthesis protein [Clostridium septicum]QAS62047.1 capsular biosynthesis protein [Clostridium septicum]UEC21497.1 capsular biosynthesis protein [Clostridium septicum]USS00456.1 Wzz/FepE/Etk N-terminal domain-containing protein [Clostridium septicum]WLF69005.1 Wzz/FepE/Etk N-terminal domain-containing protein [Clostridium septicum]